MAFLPHTVDGSKRPQSIVYLPATTITPKVGQMLYQDSNGRLALATGSGVKPTYLCLVEGDSALSNDDVIPVMRINPDWVFETTNSASFSSIKRGNKVQIASGVQVNATTSGGVAEVVDFEGTASGSKVWVRIP